MWTQSNVLVLKKSLDFGHEKNKVFAWYQAKKSLGHLV